MFNIPVTQNSRNMTRRAAMIFAVVAMIMAVPCFGKPPPGADLYGHDHEWFESLKNKVGTSCCSEADCHILKSDQWKRDPDSSYEVLIDERWVLVPPDKMSPQNSIFAAPIGCWSAAGYLYCFVAPVET